LLTREQALQILREVSCSSGVVNHCLAVEREALKIAREIQDNGHPIDLKLVEIGALLHDVGRSRTHGVSHGVIGGEILRSRGLGEFVGFAENHLGAGIPAEEAREVGLPERDFLPRTLEEKVITYADKLISRGHTISYDEALDRFKMEFGAHHPAVERFKDLHSEIQRLKG
jgi:uncharacterized protein